mmetsp:Transcript_45116/g.109798  ORF Transcript_45116/g.109798 Transcript_45116/m.109798 type:complete len:425 (+) Transcript_45116:3251-4525(+)
MGCKIPWIEYRGRWVGENGRSVVGRSYASIDDPYIDAHVAATICFGGAIAYELDTTYGVTDYWLNEICIPNIHARYTNDRRLCKVLALAMLCASFNPEARSALKIGTRIRDRFIDDYVVDNIGDRQPDELCPVKKIRVQPVPVDGELTIVKLRDVLVDEDNNIENRAVDVSFHTDATDATTTTAADATTTTTGAAAAPAAAAGPRIVAQNTTTHASRLVPNNVLPHIASNSQVLAMMSSMQTRMNQNHDMVLATLKADRMFQEQQFKMVMQRFRAYGGTIEGGFARQHAVQVAGPNPNQQQQQQLDALLPTVNPRATLHPCPRDLVMLWTEYNVGLDGRKPARDFTNSERTQTNQMKQKYWRRQHVWRVQAILLTGGLSLLEANNKILQVTGGKNVTQIINALILHRKTYKSDGGIHPSLRLTR